MITLGDQKAVLFYMGFFPAFVDLAKLTALDLLALIGVTVVAVGGVKIAYAYTANRVSHWFGDRRIQLMHRTAACILAIVAILILMRN